MIDRTLPPRPGARNLDEPGLEPRRAPAPSYSAAAPLQLEDLARRVLASIERRLHRAPRAPAPAPARTA